jgi:uncharacterized membrane protein YoaK (UPF0700 family)
MTARPVALAVGLAFVAGYVDAVGFIALFGLFTAHVTGNFILIGSALTGSGVGLAAKLMALPVFILAVAMTRLAVLGIGSDKALRPLLLGQASFLGGFLTLGLMAAPVENPDAPIVIAAGLAGVAAMGIQNAVGRLILSDLAPTTIMTGNTTQIVIDLVDRWRGGTDARTAARLRLVKMLPPLLAFAVGAIAGAFALAIWSFWCLLVPIVLLTSLVAVSGKPVGSSPAS